MDGYWLDTDPETGWIKEHISYFCRYRSIQALKSNQNQTGFVRNGTLHFWAPVMAQKASSTAFYLIHWVKEPIHLLVLFLIAVEYISNKKKFTLITPKEFKKKKTVSR